MQKHNPTLQWEVLYAVGAGIHGGILRVWLGAVVGGVAGGDDLFNVIVLITIQRDLVGNDLGAALIDTNMTTVLGDSRFMIVLYRISLNVH